MKHYCLVLAFFLFFNLIVAQKSIEILDQHDTIQRLSFNLSIGSTVGISSFSIINGYYSYLNDSPSADVGYDFSLKYYFDSKTAISFGFSYYVLNTGVKFENFNEFGNNTYSSNISSHGASNIKLGLNYYRCLKGEENSKFRIWWLGGVQIEDIKNKQPPFGGFVGLILIDYTAKEGLYPILNSGIGLDWQLHNGNIGLKIIGGLGFYYYTYYFHTAYNATDSYETVSKFKGDYVGLLATWEYGLPRRYKKDKNKKHKKKNRK